MLFAYPPEGLRKYLDWVIRHRHDRPADADRQLDEGIGAFTPGLRQLAEEHRRLSHEGLVELE